MGRGGISRRLWTLFGGRLGDGDGDGDEHPPDDWCALHEGPWSVVRYLADRVDEAGLEYRQDGTTGDAQILLVRASDWAWAHEHIPLPAPEDEGPSTAWELATFVGMRAALRGVTALAAAGIGSFTTEPDHGGGGGQAVVISVDRADLYDAVRVLRRERSLQGSFVLDEHAATCKRMTSDGPRRKRRRPRA